MRHSFNVVRVNALEIEVIWQFSDNISVRYIRRLLDDTSISRLWKCAEFSSNSDFPPECDK